MPRFGIRWLFAFTLIVAVLLALANYDTQKAYFLACIVLPFFFALASRFAAGTKNGIAVTTAILTAIMIGSLLMAYGSYYHTFTKPSVGILVGGGWTSVFASSIVGGMVGGVTGVIAMVLYLIVAALVTNREGHQQP